MTRWPVKRLEQVASIERELLQPDEITSGAKYLGLEHIAEGGEVLAAVSVQNGELKSTKFGFTDDHVLYGKLRPYLAKIALPDFAGVCSTEIVPIRPGADLDRKFLAYFLRQPSQVALATARSAGANLPRLSPSELAKFEVPVPPLPEQRRIAAILDQADALRAKRREALAKLDEMAQAIFLETYERSQGQRISLALRAVADSARHSFGNGPFGSDLLTSELQDNGVPVVYIRDIRNGEYQRVSTVYVSYKKAKELDFCKVCPDDLLISKVGDPPGVAAIYPSDQPNAIITQDVIRLRLAKNIARPEYLAAYLNSPIGKAAIATITVEATRARFSLGALKGLVVELPPLEMQLAFTARTQELRRFLGGLRVHSAHLDSLFSSLQHRAFSRDL